MSETKIDVALQAILQQQKQTNEALGKLSSVTEKLAEASIQSGMLHDQQERVNSQIEKRLDKNDKEIESLKKAVFVNQVYVNIGKAAAWTALAGYITAIVKGWI